jgi:hypothetical protein
MERIKGHSLSQKIARPTLADRSFGTVPMPIDTKSH